MTRIKVFLYFFIAIFFAGTIGFALAFIDSIELVEQQQSKHLRLQNRFAEIANYSAELQKRIEKLQLENEKNLASLAKLNLYKKRYPLYDRILDIVLKKSKEYNYHPALVLAIIQIESNFNPYAVSYAGAFGLMQIRYSVWKDELKIEKDKLFDPEYNIDLGLKIFKKYHQYSGSISRALHLYNNGFLLNNQNYSSKVIAAYQINIQNISCQN